jgi:carbon monoxide dehydrogenase subunit G
MKVEFSERVAAPPAKVFAALTDPAMIRRCVDGLEEMTPAGENAYDIRAKRGLKGKVQMLSARPPEFLSLAVEGKSFGGSLKATVEVRLRAKDGGTDVDGTGDVSVGGLLSALGSKLIESGTRKAMADFLSRLSRELTSSAS